MFGRSKPPAQEPAQTQAAPADPTAGKGHATPTRREAQQARKQQLRIPKDPKEAKKVRREQDRMARERQRQGQLAGDPRYLPARDQGPGRAFARDFVDARFTIAEYFVFVALGVLLLGFIPNQAAQTWVSLAFFAFTAVMAVDIAIVLIQLRSAARKAVDDPKDRKGLVLYAALRILQLRRLRIPPPRVRRGGRPVA